MRDCYRDHLKSLTLPIKYNNTGLDISEKYLIENRINRKLDDPRSICDYHRYSQLSYLERRFPKRQFITRGQLYMKHIKLINNKIQDAKENRNLNDSLVSEYEVQAHEVIPFEEIEQSKETNNALSETLSMSPNWQFKKKSI